MSVGFGPQLLGLLINKLRGVHLSLCASNDAYRDFFL